VSAPRKVYDLAEVIKAELEKHEAFILKVNDRVSLEVPPIALWPDKALRLDMYSDESVRMILGQSQAKAYDAYESAGGTAKLLLDLAEQHFGAKFPESPASTS